LPVDEVNGVFMSACASTQIKPICDDDDRAVAVPCTEPMASEWSPPNTTAVYSSLIAWFTALDSFNMKKTRLSFAYRRKYLKEKMLRLLFHWCGKYSQDFSYS
jgi:hypothetical protein